MRFLEISQFDKMPFGNRTPAGTAISKRTLPGTRWRTLIGTNGSSGFEVYTFACARSGDSSLLPGSLLITAQGTQTYPQGVAASVFGWVALFLADIAADAVATKTTITYGFRLKCGAVSGSFTWAGAAGTLDCARVYYSDDTYTSLVLYSDLGQPMSDGQENYLEFVIDRTAATIKVYRDNVLLRTVAFTAGKTFAGIATGLQQYSNARPTATIDVYIRDGYVIELDASDVTKRLGPQKLVNLPVKSISADTWTASPTGTDRVAALNDSQADINNAPTSNTLVVVNDTDPTAKISFDYSGIKTTDVVNAVGFTVEGLSGSTALLNVEVLKGSDSVASKQVTLLGNYVPSAEITANNYANRVAIRTPATVAAGNRTEMETHSLRLKAAAS